MTNENDIEALKQKIKLLNDSLFKIKSEFELNMLYGHTILDCGMEQFLQLLDIYSPEVIYNLHSSSFRVHTNSNPFKHGGKYALFIKNGIITSTHLDKSPNLIHLLNEQLEEFQKKLKTLKKIEANRKHQNSIEINDDNEDFENESGYEDNGDYDYDDYSNESRSPNDDRSDSMNPNNPSSQASQDNRSDQMNPNNPRYQGK